MSALAIIPTYLRAPGDLEVTLRTLETLRATAPDVDVLFVDDASPADVLVDELEDASSRLDSRLIRRPENAGFSSTVNVGLREALDGGRDAILVNADIEFLEEGWAERMASQPRADGEGPAAIVGALLLYPSGLIQHAGVGFSLLHRTFFHRYQYGPGDLPEAQHARVCAVTGALQYIRHSTLLAIGIYDEAFKLGFEDVDYCFRALTAGHDVVYQPTVRALHHESLFRGQGNEKIQTWQEESWWTFMRKWKDQSFAQWVPPM